MTSYTSKKISNLRMGVWLRVSKSFQRKQLTEEEYNTVYRNLEILHKFAGSSYKTIQMKIGPIQRYSIDYNIMKFEGKWGSTYEEKRSLAR